MRFMSGVALGSIGLAIVVAGSDCTPKKGGILPGDGGGGSGAGKGSGGGIVIGNGGGPGFTFTNTVGAGGGNYTNTDPNGALTHPVCGNKGCLDFGEPILGTGAPDNAATLFGEPTNFTAGSLCVLEPQLSAGSVEGAMLPANWVRPRFRIANATGLDLFEIRISSPAEKNDFVVYTKETTYYLPSEVWKGSADALADAGASVGASGIGFANNAAGQPVTVTIRGINSASPGKPVGVTGTFNIAPVVATGSMVFWTVNSSAVTADSSQLLGFAVGDEGVAASLKPSQAAWDKQLGEDGAVLRGWYKPDGTSGADPTNGKVRCIGCHVSTPGGDAVIFTDDWPWNKGAAMLGSPPGAIPTYVSPMAQGIMKMPWWGTQTMTKAHWADGDRILVTSYGASFQSGTLRTKAFQGLPHYDSTVPANNDHVKLHKLAWIDLEAPGFVIDEVKYPMLDVADYGQGQQDRETRAMAAKGTAWGLIATGDTTVSDTSPSFNHAGDKIVYTATDYSPDGHPDWTAKTADIKTVDYNNKAGGVAVSLPGASDPSLLEFYPSYSADDALIAFTQAPKPSAAAPDGPYYNRFGKIMVIPAAGGTATPLIANDPNACGGDVVSKGIINSWPKWSPDVVKAGGKTYYFLVFSSARKYEDEFSKQFTLPGNTAAIFQGMTLSSQLYLSAIVVDDATGDIKTYPAVYIWNQNRLGSTAGGAATAINYSNLTPAWDGFALPPLQIEQVENPPPPH